MVCLCFLWHMHQPFYKNLITGEYRLPWTRLHALKDYYGMVRILEEFPDMRQTFNLVPSMMVQVDEYARGVAADPFLQCALKPAEELSEADVAFLLNNSFHANPERLIYRYPRYGELHDAWQASHADAGRARRFFGPRALRDLQVLSQVAWFDEEFLTGDPGVRALVEKGRDFTSEDQALAGRKQREIMGLVLPAYRRLAAAGQIEISTTPYYHPILPLLCDSDIAGVSRPGATLPSRFRHPEDARRQLEMARDFISQDLGAAPAGLWPSEGSVSDEAFTLAAECGFRWAATDNGVLGRTLGRVAGVEETYRPYQWSQNGRALHVIFRDHFLSDLIGFVYSKMGAAEAAADFLDRIRHNCHSILASGRDALVPIILDGENAWEHFEQNGRPFLRELYGRISRDPEMTSCTVSEALVRIPSQPLDHIFPGSWINANFDVWIGAEEDNQAWEHLHNARKAYEAAAAAAGPAVPPESLALAYEEILIAEGSDWCWWYGPEHNTFQRADFDRLYRDHLANVYRALGLSPPEELSRPILKSAVQTIYRQPSGLVRAVIDGEVSSYFEWLGAGLYRTDERSGSMHGGRFLVRELRFGSDGERLYLRFDFTGQDLAGTEIRLHVQDALARFRFAQGAVRVVEAAASGIECQYRNVLEIAMPLDGLGAGSGAPVRFQLSLWQDGLPMDAIPPYGWLAISTSPGDWEA
ncbi:MAG: glycoside hydrolase [Candidatus Solibacter usitatus]|nr:glycoside hydrolase [Candidatus Solibacter usitatus]